MPGNAAAAHHTTETTLPLCRPKQPLRQRGWGVGFFIREAEALKAAVRAAESRQSGRLRGGRPSSALTPPGPNGGGSLQPQIACFGHVRPVGGLAGVTRNNIAGITVSLTRGWLGVVAGDLVADRSGPCRSH